jgi:hypothetical protein
MIIGKTTILGIIGVFETNNNGKTMGYPLVNIQKANWNITILNKFNR